MAPCSGYSIAVKQITPQLSSFKQAFYFVDSFVGLEFRKGSPWQPSTGCLSCYGSWQLDPQASESSAGLDIQDVTCTRLAVNAGHAQARQLTKTPVGLRCLVSRREPGGSCKACSDLASDTAQSLLPHSIGESLRLAQIQGEGT